MTNSDNMTPAEQLRDHTIAFIRCNEIDGLWPPTVGAIPNAMTSAEVLCAAEPLLHTNRASLDHARWRLLSLQQPDGAWTDPNDVDNPWDCSATAWAVWAIRHWPEAGNEAR